MFPSPVLRDPKSVHVFANVRVAATYEHSSRFWRRGEGELAVPDELSFGMHVLHAVLGQPLVHTIEERPQEATHDTHDHKERQVHCCPQVATLVPIHTLRERERVSRTGVLDSPQPAENPAVLKSKTARQL